MELIVFLSTILKVLGIELGTHAVFAGRLEANKENSIQTELVKNAMKCVLYRVCPCKGADKHCPRCKGRGIVGGTINGRLVAPKKHPKTGEILAKGTQVAVKAIMTKLATSAGLTSWLTDFKLIPCHCGKDTFCEHCRDNKGLAYDRKIVTFPPLSKMEKKTAIAAFLCAIRDNGKQNSAYPYVAIPMKGGQVVLATLDAYRELDPNLYDGKLVKRMGYRAGNFTWINKSASCVMKVAVFRNEWKRNGLLMLNTEIILNGTDYEATALRDYNGKTCKGTVRSIDAVELEWSKRHLGIIEDDVMGITTDEFVKGMPQTLVADHENYFVIEMDLKDIQVVNPPVKATGWPAIGLSLWKNGLKCFKFAQWILAQHKPLHAIQTLKKALGGSFIAECEILGVKHPKPEDEGQVPGFCFSIPRIHGTQVNWANPKDERSFGLMFHRFISYFQSHILKVDVEGVKQVLFSGSVLVDAFQDADDKYHADNNLPVIMYGIFPNCKVNLKGGKKPLVEVLMDTLKAIVLKKDPAATSLHFLTTNWIGVKQLSHFMTTGEYKVREADDTPVMCRKGAMIIASKWQKTMCNQDDDGDKGDIIVVDADKAPELPPMTDWEGLFSDSFPSAKIAMASDAEAMEYYRDVVITIHAARQAIGPMVKGSVAGAFERWMNAISSGFLDKLEDKDNHFLQQLWNAVGEIFAIKKEKSLVDSNKKFGHFTECTDLGQELWKEGYVTAKGRKVRDEDGSIANARKVYMDLIALKGEEVVWDEEGGYSEDLEVQESNDPQVVFQTLVDRASDISDIFPGDLPIWFPYLSFVKKFIGAKIQELPEQDIIPKEDDGSETPFHCFTSDSQKQHYILKKALGHFMAENGLTLENIEVFRNKARLWAKDVRAAVKDIMDLYGSESSVEKTAYTRERMAKTMDIPLTMGFVSKNTAKPWTWGPITNEKRALLFSLIVGVEDTAYRRIMKTDEYGDTYEEYVDGSRSVFNKCPFSGIRQALLAYYGAVKHMTVDEFTGNGDQTPIGEFDSWRLPKWLEADEVYHFGPDFVQVDDSDEEDETI